MMLRHLGEVEAAAVVEAGIAQVLANGSVRTPDIGGASTTRELGEAIAFQIEGQPSLLAGKRS